MKEKSKSYQTSAKTMFAAMKILSKNGGTMPIRILMQEIEKTIELSAWEMEILENTGNIRWRSNNASRDMLQTSLMGEGRRRMADS